MQASLVSRNYTEPHEPTSDKRAGVILVSELERFLLRDSQGHRAKPSDLLVNLTDGDHPPVRFVLFKDEKGVEVALPSEAIKRIDWTVAGSKWMI